MEPRDIRIEDPVEALVVEQALAMVRDLKRTCRLAPDGMVLDLAETQAVDKGRELTRSMLEAIVNAEAQEVEKKGRPREPAPADRDVRTREGAREKS